MSIPTFELPYGTVTGQYIVIKHDGADEDHLPDVQPLNGSVLLTPTVTAGGVEGALAEIAPVRLRIFGGQIVDEQQNPGARILANDADMVVEDWAWKAQVTFEDSKLRLKPQIFKLATGETVSLTSGLVPVESAPYQLVQGKPGESAYEVAVRHGYTGTESEWLESLKGDGSAWADITGKPDSFPSTVPDVQGLAARLAALEYDSGRRNIAALFPAEVAVLQASIQRVGRTVTLAWGARFPERPTSTTTGLLTLPVGFRPPSPILALWEQPSAVASSGRVLINSSNGAVTSYQSTQQSSWSYYSVTYVTPDPIPTVPFGDPS